MIRTHIKYLASISFFFLCSTSFSQTLHIPIGVDSIVYKIHWSRYNQIFCNGHPDSCEFSFAPGDLPIPFFWDSQNPEYLHCFPKDTGLIDATIRLKWYLNAPGGCPSNCKYHDSIIDNIHFSIDAHYDTTKAVVEAWNKLLVKIDIAPNPSSGFVNVKLHTDCSIKNVSICDILGNNIQTLNTSPLPKGKYTYNLSLPSGIYYLRCQSVEGIITKKIVVQ